VLISVSFVAFFILLAVAGVRRGFLLRLFAAWFLINGVFAAGLARLAGARWRSALVGGAVAWMTSVNPLLAPGWFTGYVELRHTPVNVGDIGRLNTLLSDETRPLSEILGEMFDVPLFRLMVVVALTNVGSVVASLLFAAYVLPAMAADLGGVEAVSRLMIEGATESARWLWGQVA
jgi:pheromone shutdown protein TraB